MYYKIRVKDFIRVPPSMFDMSKAEAVLKNIRSAYENFVSKKLGFVINVIKIHSIAEGVIVPGDGAGYYGTEFDLLTFKPELNELVYGSIRDITDFGAFIDMGGAEGMIHISQSMDDYVSFSKEKVLQGKKSSRALKVGDKCQARIIAISFKDIKHPKIGLTMRQEGLGKLEWINEDSNPSKKAESSGEKK
jgi:DNA-directed RNA polymerase subunit E'